MLFEKASTILVYKLLESVGKAIVGITVLLKNITSFYLETPVACGTCPILHPDILETKSGKDELVGTCSGIGSLDANTFSEKFSGLCIRNALAIVVIELPTHRHTLFATSGTIAILGLNYIADCHGDSLSVGELFPSTPPIISKKCSIGNHNSDNYRKT